MSSVVTACCDFLAKQLHPSNCLGVALFADHQSFTELSEIAWTYICNHFMSVYKNDEFLKLTEIHLAKILKNGDLSVQSEEHVFLALEAWINQNTVERQKYIAELLGYVRLPLLKQSVCANYYIFEINEVHIIEIFEIISVSHRTCSAPLQTNSRSRFAS